MNSDAISTIRYDVEAQQHARLQTTKKLDTIETTFVEQKVATKMKTEVVNKCLENMEKLTS